MKTMIVINIIDHESLVIGSLLRHELSIRMPDGTIDMVDIRDPAQKALVSNYIFVGCGDAKDIIHYYGWQSNTAPKFSVLNRGRDKSLFTDVLNFLTDFLNFLMPAEEVEPPAVLSKWSISIDVFNGDTKLPQEEITRRIVGYYKFLDRLYKEFKSGVFTDLSSARLMAEENEVKAFEQTSSILNKRLARYVRGYQLDGVYFAQIVVIDEGIYNLIRRIRLGGRNVMHISEGSYGKVIFSNYNVDVNSFMIGKLPMIFCQGG